MKLTWAQKNPERHKFLRDRWKRENAEQYKKQQKQYRDVGAISIHIKTRTKNHAGTLEKRRAWHKKWILKNPDAYRKRDLKRDYNLTQSEWDAILKSQNGRCKICGEDKPTRFHTDHCHETNRVRGILCNRCNLGIGYFKDDPKLLIAAAKYLTK